jgi:DNA-binding NarL/FixJ family response regulator
LCQKEFAAVLTDQVGDKKLRVGLFAADPLRVVGLQAIFEEQGQFDVVPLAGEGAFDVSGLAMVIIDADCTDHLFELVATFRRKHPRIKIIVIGSESDHSYIKRVIGVGVKGYLTHTARESEILMAIEVVEDGSVWAPRKVMAELLESSSAAVEEQAGKAAPKITEREAQVLRLLAEGHSNREIAEALGIDSVTVKAHVGRLMRKMGVDNRIALSMHPVTRNLEQK